MENTGAFQEIETAMKKQKIVLVIADHGLVFK